MKIFVCKTKNGGTHPLTDKEILNIKPTISKNGDAILIVNYYDFDDCLHHTIYCDRIDTITEAEGEEITVTKTSVITIYQRDYKALLKFKRFVQHYYPDYHICSKCGELIPKNSICINCKNVEHLNERIGLKVEQPNNTKQLINQLNALNEWNGKR